MENEVIFERADATAPIDLSKVDKITYNDENSLNPFEEQPKATENANSSMNSPSASSVHPVDSVFKDYNAAIFACSQEFALDLRGRPQRESPHRMDRSLLAEIGARKGGAARPVR